jgi:DNA-damage-inducible protein D
MDNQLEIFESKPIRRVEYAGEMYFSIIDIIEILTDSPNPSRYWTNPKSREKELYPNWVKLKLFGLDGKAQGVLRIIMPKLSH